MSSDGARERFAEIDSDRSGGVSEEECVAYFRRLEAGDGGDTDEQIGGQADPAAARTPSPKQGPTPFPMPFPVMPLPTSVPATPVSRAPSAACLDASDAEVAAAAGARRGLELRDCAAVVRAGLCHESQEARAAAHCAC